MSTWLPLKDAAVSLGVSEVTLKRRIKTGQVTARKEPSAKGFKWFIELPDDPAATSQTGVELQLSQIIQLLREEVGAKNQQIAELHTIIDHLTRQMPTLIEAPAAPVATDPAPDPPRKKRWWHFAS